MNADNIKFQQKTFQNLTALELYKILQLRSAVFVVEQNCIYQDLDNHDLAATHLWLQQADEIIAYARILPKGTVHNHAAIGRVIVSQKYRGRHLAETLMQHAMDVILIRWKEKTVQIQAQVYVQEFYRRLGFEPASEQYEEDGIPHLDMIYTEKQKKSK